MTHEELDVLGREARDAKGTPREASTRSAFEAGLDVYVREEVSRLCPTSHRV
jgi:hypothetical protein